MCTTTSSSTHGVDTIEMVSPENNQNTSTLPEATPSVDNDVTLPIGSTVIINNGLLIQELIPTLFAESHSIEIEYDSTTTGFVTTLVIINIVLTFSYRFHPWLVMASIVVFMHASCSIMRNTVSCYNTLAISLSIQVVFRTYFIVVCILHRKFIPGSLLILGVFCDMMTLSIINRRVLYTLQRRHGHEGPIYIA